MNILIIYVIHKKLEMKSLYSLLYLILKSFMYDKKNQIEFLVKVQQKMLNIYYKKSGKHSYET